MYMRELMTVTKALSDQNRVRMLMALERQELCVCQVTELFGLAPSTVSKHLSLLYQAGLVDSRKDGRWIFYRMAGKQAPLAVQKAIEWIKESIRKDPIIAEDTSHLKKILKLDPAEICERICRK
jgi:ArsR family transcriptional regulator, arsenate/arsenite/antimonite-responsive transcriptional repressor